MKKFEGELRVRIEPSATMSTLPGIGDLDGIFVRIEDMASGYVLFQAQGPATVVREAGAKALEGLAHKLRYGK